MLNNSITQLRQIALANLSLASPTRRRDVPTLSPSNSPIRHYGLTNASDGDEGASRPSALRRRSTRGNPVSEPPISRFQRLEVAIENRSIESFFVIHDELETIYISEILPGQSPCFLPFVLDCRSRTLAIVIYARQMERRWRRLSTQAINLGTIDRLGLEPVTNAANAVLMQFTDDLWYTSHDSDLPAQRPYVTPRGDSYSLGQVLRLQSSTECINDSLLSVTSLKSELNSLLNDAQDRTLCLRQVRIAKTRLMEIRKEINQVRQGNTSKQSRNSRLRDAISLRKSLISSAEKQISLTRVHLNAEVAQKDKSLPALYLLSSEITRLQRELTTILVEIYPITNTATTSRIRGLRTAKDSDYWMHNPEESAALGYIAHFVFLLSYYLSIPLRYPTRPLSSHSYVIDPVSILPSTSDVHGGPPYSIKRDRNYPLFFERGGVQRLQWAVYLLNKDIEQLLQGRGLVCGDIRHSLPNLDALIVWLVSVNEDEDRTLSVPAIVLNGRTNGQSGESTTLTAEGETAINNGTAGLCNGPEITDHDDLLAAQLRSVMRKGKVGVTQPGKTGVVTAGAS